MCENGHEFVAEEEDAPGWTPYVCTVCGLGKRIQTASQTLDKFGKVLNK